MAISPEPDKPTSGHGTGQREAFYAGYPRAVGPQKRESQKTNGWSPMTSGRRAAS
jgi:hypothetical protein